MRSRQNGGTHLLQIPKIFELPSCHHLETGYQWANPAIPFHLALQTSHNLCLNFCGCHSQLFLSFLLGFLMLLCVRKLPAWCEAQQNQPQTTAEKSWIIRNDFKDNLKLQTLFDTLLIWLVVSIHRQNGFIFPNFRGENKKYLKRQQTLGNNIPPFSSDRVASGRAVTPKPEIPNKNTI